MIKIRPFQPEDWDVLLELANQAVPFAPRENAEWLQYRKAFDPAGRIRRHFIAEQDGAPVGYGCLEQQSEDAQVLRVYVVCSPHHMAGQVGRLLFEHARQQARELGAAHLWAREYQADEPARQFFTGQGFVEAQRLTLPGQPPVVVYTMEVEFQL